MDNAIDRPRIVYIYGKVASSIELAGSKQREGKKTKGARPRANTNRVEWGYVNGAFPEGRLIEHGKSLYLPGVAPTEVLKSQVFAHHLSVLDFQVPEVLHPISNL